MGGRRLSTLLFATTLLVVARPSAAGDSPTEDAQILRIWAAIEEAKFGSRGLYLSGVREQMAEVHQRTQEKRMKAVWYRAEGVAFSRLATDILNETDRLTRRKVKLRDASETAARFVSAGVVMPKFRSRFVDLVMMTGVRGEVRQIMAREIGPIEADDFAGHRLYEVVLPSGDLDPPPPSLLATVGRADGAAIFGRLRAGWRETASALRAGGEPPAGPLEAMLVAVDEWEATFIGNQPHPTPAAANYVENVRRLVVAAGSPSEREAVVGFLRDGGHAFPGGTFGDLLLHVVRHRLAPRAGTPGSLAVGELTQTMIDRADAEIAQLDIRLEKLKRQSPAHNAVLRERMVPRYFSDKGAGGVYAGINSPAFAE